MRIVDALDQIAMSIVCVCFQLLFHNTHMTSENQEGSVFCEQHGVGSHDSLCFEVLDYVQ